MAVFSRRFFSHFDPYLFCAMFALACFGVLAVYSANSSSGIDFFQRQLLWVSIGLLIFFVLACLDYHFCSDHALLLYVGSLLILASILVFGTEIKGNKSWLSLGTVTFQPSEPIKLVMVLTLSRYVAEINEKILSYRHLFVMGVLTLLPVGLIILQGDLGTALVYIPILFGILVVSGMRWRPILVLVLACLLVSPMGWFLLKDYQKQRILVTMDPERDPQGVGYQARQSQIAIGSGGLLGKGFGNGMQGQLGFVPEIHTDFIFALLAEERGFVGAAAILFLYLVILARMIRIAENARDRTGILIITGVTSMLFFHVILNVGMTLGLLPAIGIPLPLLSYGGSSTLTIFAALGMAQNVHSRRFIY